MNNFKKLSNDELLTRAKENVMGETAATLEVLHTLREIDRRKAFADKSYPSLFEFCVDYLGYKRGAAYRRIMAMRALKDLPEIEERIQKGALSLMTVSQAQSFFHERARNFTPISADKKREMLKSLENKSTRETEKFFLEQEVMSPQRESIRQIDGENYQLKAVLPRRVREKLLEVQRLMGPQGNNITNVEILERALDLSIRYLRSRSAKHVPAKDYGRKVPVLGKMKTLWMRDQGQCTFVNSKTNVRCPQTTYLEVDHIQPRAMGGDSSLENLRLLCRAHNQRAAIRVFGLEKMERHWS